MKIKLKSLVPTLLVLVCFINFLSCKNDSKQQATEKKEKFCLTDTMMKKMTFDEVAVKTLVSEVKLSGKITANEDRIAKVFPRVDGNVSKLYVELGDYVRKGQILAVVKSSEIAGLDNDLNISLSNVQIAKKNYDVAEELYKSGLGTEKDVVTARQELQKSESELRKVRETMKIYNLKPDSRTSYNITSPISGFIIEKEAVEDMDFRIENVDHFFTISDLNDVWVIADVYETDINRVKVGYTCEITTLADPDKKIYGKIDKIFNVLDPESRVMKVRIRLPNPTYTLKPQMFASVIVHHEEGKRMMAIPAKAVIFDKSKHWVMIFKDKCNIETRQVEVFKIVGEYAYIDSGLSIGEKIISTQQLLVYDALND